MRVEADRWPKSPRDSSKLLSNMIVMSASGRMRCPLSDSIPYPSPRPSRLTRWRACLISCRRTGGN